MRIEEFYEQFEGLEAEISKSNKKTPGLKEKTIMRDILVGLRRTSKRPENYGCAYYFVSEITSIDIRTTDEPSLFEPCPQCKTNLPVLMRYTMIDTGIEEDETWEKQALTMCRRDGIHKLPCFTRDYRF